VLAWDYQRSAAKDEAKREKELEYRAGVDGHFSEIEQVSSLHNHCTCCYSIRTFINPSSISQPPPPPPGKGSLAQSGGRQGTIAISEVVSGAISQQQSWIRGILP